MLRMVLCALTIASAAVLSAGAQPIDQPATLTPDGGTAALTRAGQAARVHLLGFYELYSLAVYVDAPPIDRARLLSPDVPKALRIEIRYRDDLSRRKPAIDWQGELIPRLEEPAIAHLRGAFAPLRQGDVVLVEYVPGKGTTVRINKGVTVPAASHDLMLAFLDHWIGQRPVSEEIKRTLLGSFRFVVPSCRRVFRLQAAATGNARSVAARALKRHVRGFRL